MHPRQACASLQNLRDTAKKCWWSCQPRARVAGIGVGVVVVSVVAVAVAVLVVVAPAVGAVEFAAPGGAGGR